MNTNIPRRIGPERHPDRRQIEISDVLAGRRFHRRSLAIDDSNRRLAFAVVAGGHAEQLAEFDIRLAGVVQRKGFREIFLGEDERVEAVGDFVVKFLKHDSASDAGEGLAGGGHVGIGVAMGASEIALEDQIAVADDEQAAVLGATLGEVIGPFKRGLIHPGQLATLGRIVQFAPSAGAVGGWEIDGRKYWSGGEQQPCQNQDQSHVEQGGLGRVGSFHGIGRKLG